MAKKRYAGFVKLGAIYVTPAGVECKPVAFTMSGVTVEFSGNNYAFTRNVTRADFAAYVLKPGPLTIT